MVRCTRHAARYPLCSVVENIRSAACGVKDWQRLLIHKQSRICALKLLLYNTVQKAALERAFALGLPLLN